MPVLNLRFRFRISAISTQPRLRSRQKSLDVGTMADDHLEAASDHQ